MSHRRHFHGVGYLLTILLVGSNMPSPLYGVYREQFGFSPVVQTLVFAVYAAALVPALLLFGPMSDRVGRRPVLAVALGFGALGSVVMACASGTTWLFLARVVQGVAVGACSAAGAAALVEHEPHGDHRRAGLAATATTALGASLGPLLAGALAQYVPHPLVLPYLVYLVTLVPAVVVLWVLPGRRPVTGTGDVGAGGVDSPMPRPARIPLRVPSIPREVRGTFVAASAAAAAGWAVVGLFQAVVPSWITGMLGVDNLVVGAAVAALVMVCSVTAQLAVRGLRPRASQRAGLALLVVGTGGLLLADDVRSLAVLFATTVVVGLGHGLAFAGAMRGLTAEVAASAPHAHGGVIAAFYTVTYAGLGLPTVGAGLLITWQGMTPAIAEFSVVGLAVCVLLLVVDWRAGHDGHPRAVQRMRP